jgi:hypothetical protein
MEVSTQLHIPPTPLPKQNPQYTIYRRLNESHRLSGHLEKKNISCPSEIGPCIFQITAYSAY